MNRKVLAIRYFSKTGSIKKLAEAMAQQIHVDALDVSHPVLKADILFLGASVYWFGLDPNVKEFVKTLHPDQVKKVVIFSTATFIERAYSELKELLERQNIEVINRHFCCHESFMPFHSDCPTTEDVSDAKRFAKVLSEKLD
ncbi:MULTISPECIES: flavodoxin domain-containing protein [Terrabacteria group]|uniref:flavodoxin family protein n=1 Tax=Bacillati TaxID=1783272 RepID=UPI0019395BD0|nr:MULTISPECIES: flavodoxin domain-containing protein [Terrabacteria group]MBW9212185.1 hypothetical protein [Trueperella sp. zg.1013]QRG86270.1 hypothetical protein JOS54_05250 [Bulleidia sp. zg-1006]